jgi:hypothetical protein
MRLLYFSTDFGPHDHRFLSALANTSHDVHFVRLARQERQVEDRPVPSAVKQVAWAGDGPFGWWMFLPDLKRAIRDIRPDLIHVGLIQTCAFIAVLTGFRPILTMSGSIDAGCGQELAMAPITCHAGRSDRQRQACHPVQLSSAAP